MVARYWEGEGWRLGGRKKKKKKPTKKRALPKRVYKIRLLQREPHTKIFWRTKWKQKLQVKTKTAAKSSFNVTSTLSQNMYMCTHTHSCACAHTLARQYTRACTHTYALASTHTHNGIDTDILHHRQTWQTPSTPEKHKRVTKYMTNSHQVGRSALSAANLAVSRWLEGKKKCVVSSLWNSCGPLTSWPPRAVQAKCRKWKT